MAKIDPMPPTESNIIAENLETGFIDEKRIIIRQKWKIRECLSANVWETTFLFRLKLK